MSMGGHGQGVGSQHASLIYELAQLHLPQIRAPLKLSRWFAHLNSIQLKLPKLSICGGNSFYPRPFLLLRLSRLIVVRAMSGPL